MAFEDDIADDWEIFDGVEDFTYTPRNPDAAPVTDIKGLFGCISAKLLATGIGDLKLNADDCQVSLWRSTFSSIPPFKQEDVITKQSDNTQWRVLYFDLLTMDTRWVFYLRKMLT